MSDQVSVRWLVHSDELVDQSRAHLADAHDLVAGLADRLGRTEEAARHRAAAALHRPPPRSSPALPVRQ